VRSALSAALVLALVLATTQSAQAGWTQPQGSGYAKIWGHFIAGERAFGLDGNLIDSEPFSLIGSNLYAEFGITDTWTAVAQAKPYERATYGGANANVVGPIQLGIRSAVLTGPLKLAAEIRYGFAPPVGDRNLAAEDSALAFIPTFSTHSASGEVQVGYGFSRYWVRASAGMRLFSLSGLDPAITSGFQFGASMPAGFVADLHLGLNQPLGELTQVNVAGAGQSAYLGVGVAVSWWFLPQWGVMVGADGAAFAKSNAGALVLLLGLEHRI